MESKIKCSSKDHPEIDAIKYCKKCEIYMCKKCLGTHSNLLPNHQASNIGEEKNETISEFCREEKHNQALEYYCKTHNKLCCALCITKIQGNGKGQHKNCDICVIDDYKNQKHSQLKENISKLEELLNCLNKIINQSKELFEKMETKKEQLKNKIQKTFTALRSALNAREDILLSQVDNNYSIIYKGYIRKEGEKLLDKIRKTLEKGKTVDKEYNDKNKLYSFINECITFENNMKEINVKSQNIKSENLNAFVDYKFIPENIETYYIFQNISNFGKIQNLTENNNNEESKKGKKEESKKEETLKSEEEFPTFIEKFKNQLKIEKKLGDKNEIDIEIRSSKNEPKGASIDLLTIDQKLFKEYFFQCEEQIKSALFAFNFIFELKNEEDLNNVIKNIEMLKLMIRELPFYKAYPDRYDIIFKNKGKKLSFVFIIKEGKKPQLLLELLIILSECIKFHFNIKTEINFTELFNNSSDEYISNLFNVLVKAKISGKNLKYLQNTTINALKDLKLRRERKKADLINLIDFIMLFIGINLKVEYDIGFFKNKENDLKKIKNYIYQARSLSEVLFRPIIEGYGLRNLFTDSNLDCLSFSFGMPKYEKGLAIVIKLSGITQYFKDLFK